MSVDYGKTLNLPKTDFPMRGNLPQREPEFLKKWEDMDIYKNSLRKMKESLFLSYMTDLPMQTGEYILELL